MQHTRLVRTGTQRHWRLRGCVLLWLCAASMLPACSPTQEIPLPTVSTVQPTATGTPLSFTTIAQGDHLSANLFVEKPSIIIITSAQEVDAALRQAAGDPPVLERNPHPVEQARQLNYTTSFAILVLQGQQGTSGYSVTIDQVIRQGDQVQVQATFVRPEDQSPAATSAVITDPYHLIAVPKTTPWGHDIQFRLMIKQGIVAETTHFIP